MASRNTHRKKERKKERLMKQLISEMQDRILVILLFLLVESVRIGSSVRPGIVRCGH